MWPPPQVTGADLGTDALRNELTGVLATKDVPFRTVSASLITGPSGRGIPQFSRRLAPVGLRGRQTLIRPARLPFAGRDALPMVFRWRKACA